MGETKITTKKIGDKYQITTENITLQDNESKQNVGIRTIIDVYDADRYKDIRMRVQTQLEQTEEQLKDISAKALEIEKLCPKRTHDSLKKESDKLEKVLKYRELQQLYTQKDNLEHSVQHLKKELNNLEVIE